MTSLIQRGAVTKLKPSIENLSKEIFHGLPNGILRTYKVGIQWTNPGPGTITNPAFDISLPAFDFDKTIFKGMKAMCTFDQPGPPPVKQPLGVKARFFSDNFQGTPFFQQLQGTFSAPTPAGTTNSANAGFNYYYSTSGFEFPTTVQPGYDIVIPRVPLALFLELNVGTWSLITADTLSFDVDIHVQHVY